MASGGLLGVGGGGFVGGRIVLGVISKDQLSLCGYTLSKRYTYTLKSMLESVHLVRFHLRDVLRSACHVFNAAGGAVKTLGLPSSS